VPRTSKGPRYYKSKGGWFANIKGERILLVYGPKKKTEEVAKEKYDAEVEARKVEVEGDRSKTWSVLNAYIRHLETRDDPKTAPNTIRIARKYFDDFCAMHGLVPIRDLRQSHYEEWIAVKKEPRFCEKAHRMVGWGSGSIRLARNNLMAAFRWAAEEAGFISVNPLARRGEKRRRVLRTNYKARKVAITDAEYKAFLDRADRRSHKDFYYLLQFLYETGARPSEMYLAKAEEWDEEKKAFVMEPVIENQGRYKLLRHGEKRTIYVPDKLVPLAKELMAKYPTGPIFRTERGDNWSAASISNRFDNIKKALNKEAAQQGKPQVIRDKVTCYSLRHAFVTRWIQAKRYIPDLCELLQTSETMLRRHYSHLFEQHQTLRGALNDFSTGMAGKPETLTGPDQPGVAS
jgi:integrase